ncbi:MAG TPA: hypothetical protein VLR26_09830 [Frankiaceae bacterium]|nr:hypothetical protein [Frankiaceae bacterium]
MAAAERVVDLLLRAGAAALGGTPSDADEPLAELAAADRSGSPLDGEVRARVVWLTGVSLGARGRYAEALDALEPLTSSREAAPPEVLVVRAAALATAASLLRQIGDHPAADPLDAAAVGLLAGVPLAVGTDVRLDCAVGWTADAVGLGDLPLARQRLDSARLQLGPALGWRPVVRLHWVETEVALLAGEIKAASTGARAAVELARTAGAPRHLAKSSMFLGVVQALDGDLPQAASTLRTAADLADRHGLLPLVWPVRAVLATMPGLVGDPLEADGHRAAARSAARSIGSGLPPERRRRWEQRDPMAAFLLSDDSHERGRSRQGS